MPGIVQLILVIIIIILMFYVFLKVLKSVIKAVTSVVLIIFLIAGVFGVLVYMDYKDIKNNMGSKESLLVLQANDEIVTVAEIIPSQLKSGNMPFSAIDNNSIIEKLQQGEFNLDNYYKTIVLQEKILKEGLPQEMSLPGGVKKNITREEYLQFLHSDNPKEEFAEHMNIRAELIDSMLNRSGIKDLKTTLLGYAVQQVIEEKGEIYFIKKYRQKEIQMHPDSLSLSLLRMAPLSMFTSAVNQTG